jgi:hypothetical protein
MSLAMVMLLFFPSFPRRRGSSGDIQNAFGFAPAKRGELFNQLDSRLAASQFILSLPKGGNEGVN